jgi:hypothetical protein
MSISRWGTRRRPGAPACSDLKRSGKLVPLKDKYGKAMRGETRTGNAAAILVADIFAPAVDSR